ncbi:hypothetical protein PLAN_60127 [Planktothrix rubescens CCAP 1459/22]|uniref:Uncharacterized protein n=1 Tax=Planktothrix rubescens CCAP 1459/22 TaxID=329571 RepID=A0A6J7ZRL0_PLARU|nr:hypothetical protein PLAN_60127 [Planktothrix rubescens NIVA-CYA 18]
MKSFIRGVSERSDAVGYWRVSNSYSREQPPQTPRARQGCFKVG